MNTIQYVQRANLVIKLRNEMAGLTDHLYNAVNRREDMTIGRIKKDYQSLRNRMVESGISIEDINEYDNKINELLELLK